MFDYFLCVVGVYLYDVVGVSVVVWVGDEYVGE